MSGIGWIELEETAALLQEIASGAGLGSFQINVIMRNEMKLHDLAWKLVNKGWAVNLISPLHMQAFKHKNSSCIDARVAR